MHDFVLQELTTERGSFNFSVSQGTSEWLDLEDFQDVTFWLDIREVTFAAGMTSITIDLQTAPIPDEALFVDMTLGGYSQSSTTPPSAPVSQQIIMAQNPTVPLGRYVRWRLTPVGGTSGSWDMTFRIVCAANHVGSGERQRDATGRRDDPVEAIVEGPKPPVRRLLPTGVTAMASMAARHRGTLPMHLHEEEEAQRSSRRRPGHEKHQGPHGYDARAEQGKGRRSEPSTERARQHRAHLEHARRVVRGKPRPKLTHTIKDVKHVVILMQENRSFDEYFGMLEGVRGFCDADVTGVFKQTIVPTTDYLGSAIEYPHDTIYPWHMDTTTTLASIVVGEAVDWGSQHYAYSTRSRDRGISSAQAAIRS